MEYLKTVIRVLIWYPSLDLLQIFFDLSCHNRVEKAHSIPYSLSTTFSGWLDKKLQGFHN